MERISSGMTRTMISRPRCLVLVLGGPTVVGVRASSAGWYGAVWSFSRRPHKGGPPSPLSNSSGLGSRRSVLKWSRHHQPRMIRRSVAEEGSWWVGCLAPLPRSTLTATGLLPRLYTPLIPRGWAPERQATRLREWGG